MYWLIGLTIIGILAVFIIKSAVDDLKAAADYKCEGDVL
jgi:hypothetical protein